MSQCLCRLGEPRSVGQEVKVTVRIRRSPVLDVPLYLTYVNSASARFCQDFSHLEWGEGG